MSVNEKMTALADEIRTLSGGTEKIGLDAMTNNIKAANAEIVSQENLIIQITNALEGKSMDGSVEQATPVIKISSNGLITATAGSKSATKQLAFQPAKTITPSTTDQIAVSSGYYTGGDITILGDSNLIADNIKSGISIFGIEGTANVGNGGTTNELLEQIMGGTITTFNDNSMSQIRGGLFYDCKSLSGVNLPECTTIKPYAFYSCTKLTSVNLPKCSTIGSAAFGYCLTLKSISLPACISVYNNAFQYCYSLNSISLPECVTIYSSAFYKCEELTTINLPKCATISGYYTFAYCSKLTSVDLPVCTAISSYVFTSCSILSTIILRASSVCRLGGSNTFSFTPYAGYKTYFSGTPYIYVPASLVSAYKIAQNWSYFSSYFSAIEDMEV